MIKIAPSILSADFTDLKSDFKRLEDAGVEIFHMDIMDGNFVPNITFGSSQLKQMRKLTNAFFDTHLMITNPDLMAKDFAEAGSDLICVHCEACTHLQRTLAYVKSLGVKVGVALNPATPLCNVEYVLDDIDMLMLMTVNPGFGGQEYIKAMTEKIKRAKQLIGDRDIILEVDGGVNLDTFPEIYNAGADWAVSGSYVFNGDIKENIDNLYKKINGGN